MLRKENCIKMATVPVQNISPGVCSLVGWVVKENVKQSQGKLSDKTVAPLHKAVIKCTVVQKSQERDWLEEANGPVDLTGNSKMTP